jgi:hypothetical protein
MAKKSKGFGKSLDQQDSLIDQQAMAKLKRKLRSGPFSNTDVVVNPEGFAKMSEVLAEFVSPYQHIAKSRKAYESLLGIAILAWNISILPEDEQQKFFDKAIQQVIKLDSLTQQDIKSLLNDLLTRKKKYFADNKRLIMDFQLQEIGSRYHLSVATDSME